MSATRWSVRDPTRALEVAAERVDVDCMRSALAAGANAVALVTDIDEHARSMAELVTIAEFARYANWSECSRQR